MKFRIPDLTAGECQTLINIVVSLARLEFFMARYTAFFAIAVEIGDLRRMLIDILESCNLEVTYETPSSLISREFIGHVPSSRLVTVEIIFDTATSTDSETKMTLVAKNDELPLKMDNHCRQIFELINQLIIDNRQWELLESMTL